MIQLLLSDVLPTRRTLVATVDGMQNHHRDHHEDGDKVTVDDPYAGRKALRRLLHAR